MKKIIFTLMAATCLGILHSGAAESDQRSLLGYQIQEWGEKGDTSSIGKLKGILNGQEKNLAYAAAQALAKIGDSRSANLLVAALVNGKADIAGDAALIASEARAKAGDVEQRLALLLGCYNSPDPQVKYAALIQLALLDPDRYGTEIERAFLAGYATQSAAADKAVRSSKALLPAALRAAKQAQGIIKARILATLTHYAQDPEAKKILTASLTDPSVTVRRVALRATAATCDPAAFDGLWNACRKPDKEGVLAVLMVQANASPALTPYLLTKFEEPQNRALAIGLLASRHDKVLFPKLYNPELYQDQETVKAAAAAFRSSLPVEEFPKAMDFTFNGLPARKQEPFVSALSSVLRQMPNPEQSIRAFIPQFKGWPEDIRISAMPLIATLQTPMICQILADEYRGGKTEYRKEIVRTLSKWALPQALELLTVIAQKDKDRAVRILSIRNILSMLNRKRIVNREKAEQILKTLAEVADRDEERVLITNSLKTFTTPAQTRSPLPEFPQDRIEIPAGAVSLLAINMGGPSKGHFSADTAQGGLAYSIKNDINVKGVKGAAPVVVYQTSRYGNCTYRYRGFKPNGSYALRLHYAETFHRIPGKRAGSVIVNGIKIVNNLASREYCKAYTLALPVKADSEGKIEIRFETTKDQVMANAFEIFSTQREGVEKLTLIPCTAVAAKVIHSQPGKINVLILTGANNHKWQLTTAALLKIFEKDSRFAVQVNEKPWEMTPGSIKGFDLIFCNWNTFGRDKREWSSTMKEAFITWVKQGGGFFVLHAGGSFFYNWPEFQKLIGGTWIRGRTFHPRIQPFTVHIEKSNHPVTRGLSDFQTVDEPWQRLSNGNPERKILATAVIPKANGGSGDREVYALSTTLGKGRCFNLVLGHDVRALNNPGCTTLILRGSEWAATGEVK